MPVKVTIPVAYRSHTQGRAAIESNGIRVADVLVDLTRRFPGLRDKMYDNAGVPRSTLNIYLNREDIRFLDGHDTAVAEGDEITLLMPASGG